MIPMVARKPFRYGSRALVAGDSFSARDQRDAKLLRLIGNASDEEAKKPKKETEEADLKPKSGKRHYFRRDMEAGDKE